MREHIKRLKLLAWSLRYTKPRQIASRVALHGQRRVERTFARWHRRARASSSAEHALADNPPTGLLVRRTHLLTEAENGQRYVLLPGFRLPLVFPMLWQLPALDQGTRLAKLTLHYMEFLDELESPLFAKVIEDWIDQNPPFGDKFWLDNWNSFALSIRVVVWMKELTRREMAGETFAETFRGRVISSLAYQLDFLLGHLEDDIGGNHLIKNIKALLWGGRFFADAAASTQYLRGADLLEDELDAQVLADGMHFERSPTYHVQVFADLVDCHSALHAGPLRDKLAARLRMMAQVLVDLHHPDSRISLFGDGTLDTGYSQSACLAALLELATNDKVSEHGDHDHPYKGPTPRQVFFLASAGYAGRRGPSDYFLLDVGGVEPAHLPAHAHGDVFAFEWTVGTQRVAVDAGVYTYDDGPWRAYSRSTLAHNTVTIDDRDQAEFWRSFRVGRRPRVLVERLESLDEMGTGFRFSGSHDGFATLPGRPIHRRTVTARPGEVAVEDEILGGQGQYTCSRVLLHPAVQAFQQEDRRLELRWAGQARALVVSSHRIGLRAGWWSPSFGDRVSTTQLEISYGVAPTCGYLTMSLL